MVSQQLASSSSNEPTPLPTAGWDAPAVKIHLLGGFRVVVHQSLVDNSVWRLSKSRSLLQLLALSPNHALHRDQVMELFWPEQSPKAAAANFYQVIHSARRALHGDSVDRTRASGVIHLRRQVVALEPPGPLWVDVTAFYEAAGTAGKSGNIDDYRRALDLYGGDLLPEHPYDDWLDEHRARLRDLQLKLLLELADLCVKQGQHADAIEALEQAVDCEPALEAAHVALMQLYSATGQAKLAVRQYQELCRALQQIDAQPDIATSALCEEIGAGRFVRNAEAPIALQHTGLPVPFTSFIGHEAEVCRISDRIGTSRLITLTGAGGCGKSRLALEVAIRIREDYHGDIYLVELAPFDDPLLVVRATATAVGITEQQGQSLEQSLIMVLRQRPTLLILDNCEHVIEECATLAARLLSQCPDIRILATSRERLRVDGEMVWQVPPLAVPEKGATFDQLCQAESVRLFMERTRQVRPDFQLTETKASVIASICRYLDGMPLAIELAAARTSVMSVEQIAARLDDSLGLLTTGSRGASPRHVTLRATLDWSYRLLSGPESALLRSLSIFAGSWTVEAAEAIVFDTQIQTHDVLVLLASLVERSLVQVELAEDEYRYRMLETIRQYSRERLEASGESAAVQRSHAAYFAHLALAAVEELRAADQVIWLARLHRERDNFRIALAWASEHDEARIGLELCWGLWRYWQANGDLSEGRFWMTTCLALSSQVDTEGLRARVLFAAARLAYLQSDDLEAQTLSQECLELARRIAHTAPESGVLIILGERAGSNAAL